MASRTCHNCSSSLVHRLWYRRDAEKVVVWLISIAPISCHFLKHGGVISLQSWLIANNYATPNGGAALFLTGSMLNHSCKPNCTLKGNVFVASRDIAVGEELTVSYCPADLEHEMRRNFCCVIMVLNAPVNYAQGIFCCDFLCLPKIGSGNINSVYRDDPPGPRDSPWSILLGSFFFLFFRMTLCE